MTDAQSWFHNFVGLAVQPIPYWIEFFLRYLVGPFALIVAGRWLGHQFPKTLAPIHIAHSRVKKINSPNDELIIKMSASTLETEKLTNGQKVNLFLNNGDKIPVTVKKRRDTQGFGDSVEIAASIFRSADLTLSTVNTIRVEPVGIGWTWLMLQSFNHPDVNVRLAWLLSLWSFVVSTMAGVIISHFHMLVQK